jgi:hypothetical protein
VPAEGNPGASVPPQPDTYTFSQRSTKKAVGEMFGKLPVDVPKFAEYKNYVRSGCKLEINCFLLKINARKNVGLQQYPFLHVK